MLPAIMKRTAADARWSKAVRERDGYRCRRCGKPHAKNSQGLHAAHIFSRGIIRTRHDPDNGLSMCYGCHRVFDQMQKSDRERYVRSLIGDEKYELLAGRARSPRKRCVLTDCRDSGCA